MAIKSPFQPLFDDENWQKLLEAIAKRTVQVGEAVEEGPAGVTPYDEIETGLEALSEEELAKRKEFDSKKAAEIAEVERKYGIYLDNIQDDGEGNPLITPDDRLNDAQEIESTPNYTYQDLLNTYRGVPGLENYGDDELLNYVKQYKPEDYAKVTPEVGGWGKGWAARELRMSWHEVKGRWADTMPMAHHASSALLAGDEGEGLNDPTLHYNAVGQGKTKKQLFREHLKEINPYKSDIWIEEEIQRVQEGDLKNLYANVINQYEEKQLKFQRFLESNPDIAAQYEWNFKNLGSEWSLRKDGFDNMGKWAFNMMIQGLPTMIESVVTGHATGLLFQGIVLGGTWLGRRAGIPISPLLATSLGQKAYQFGLYTGQFGYGKLLEGGGHLIEAIDEQTNYRQIDKRTFAGIINAKKEEFEKDAENPSQAEQWLKDYIQNNLEKKDNTYYIKPISTAEAIDNAVLTAEAQGWVGGGIEMIDVAFTNARVIPHGMKGFSNYTLYRKMLSKIDDVTRTVKAKSPWIARPILGIGEIGMKTIARGAPEGLEEIGQSLSNIGLKVHGPLFMDEFKWDVGATWENRFSYAKDIRDPFVSGVLAGGPTSFAGITAEQHGVMDYFANRSRIKAFEKGETGGFYYRVTTDEKGKKVYKLSYGQSILNEKTGKYDLVSTDVTQEQTKDPSTGEIDQVEFENRVDANRIASKYNTLFSKKYDKINLWNNRGIVDSTTEINERKKPDKDGNRFIVYALDKNGITIETVGKYKYKWQANRASKDYNKGVAGLKSKLEKHGYKDISELSNDPDIIKYQERIDKHQTNIDNQVNEARDSENIDESDVIVTPDSDPNKGENQYNSTDADSNNIVEVDTKPGNQEYTETEYGLALKSFMEGSTYAIEAGIEIKEEDRTKAREFQDLMLNNPNILRDAIDNHPDLLDKIGGGSIAKEDFIRDIDDAYGDPQLTRGIADVLLPDKDIPGIITREDDVSEKPVVEEKPIVEKPVEEAPIVTPKEEEKKEEIKRPKAEPTPTKMSELTDKQLDAKIAKAKKDAKSKVKYKQTRARASLKAAETEKVRRETQKGKDNAKKWLAKYRKERGREFGKWVIGRDADYQIVHVLPDRVKKGEITQDFVEGFKEEIKRVRKEEVKKYQEEQDVSKKEEKKAPEVEVEKKPVEKMSTENLVNEINENLDNLSDKDITAYINEIEKRMKDRVSKMMNPDSISPKVAEMEDAIKKGKAKLEDLKMKIGSVIPEGSKDEKRTKNVLKYLFDKFAGEIEYETINDPTLFKNGKPVEAYYDVKKKKVIINTAFATSSSPFHEFSHPFITVLRTENKTLFNNLVKEILATPEGKDLMKQILKAYGKDKKPTDIDVLEELLAFSIEKSADKQYKPKSEFKRIVNKILNWLRAKLFGKSNTVYAQALDTNTTIEDIGRLFANSDTTIRFKNRDKSLADTNYDFSKNPQNIYQLKLKIEKEGKELIVSDVGVRHIKGMDKDLKSVEDKVNKVIDETPSNQPGEKGTVKRTGHKAVWFGPVVYDYTGARHIPKKMPPEIVEIMHAVEESLGLPRGYYDSVLINQIPKGVSIEAHKDDESIFIQEDGTIGSVGVVSFGGTSVIKILPGRNLPAIESHEISDGEVYELPQGKFQNIFFHQVGGATGPRVSLTFRRTNTAPPIKVKKEDKKKVPYQVKKIISGGQIGADLLGLEVGKELGLETGGTAPPGFISGRKEESEKLKGYGLVEGEVDPKTYVKRTIKNVVDSDGTVIFSPNVNSPGTKLTINAAKSKNKPYIVNPTAEELQTWLSENNIKTLNVAGNRATKPEQVKPILTEAIKGTDIKKEEEYFEEIVSELHMKGRALHEVHVFFQGAWDVMFAFAKENDMAINVNDFIKVVSAATPNLQNALELWLYDKFKGKKIIGGYDKSLIPISHEEGSNNPNIADKFKDILDGVDEGLNLDTMLEVDAQYEKDLTVNDIMYLRELKVNITVDQLYELYTTARESDYKHFEDWRDNALRIVLKRSTEITLEQDRALLKLYNRLNSSVPVNRKKTKVDKTYIETGHTKVDFRTNYILKWEWNKQIGDYNYFLTVKEDLDDDGRSNPQYDKRYLFEFNPENEVEDIFHWVSGIDVRTPGIKKDKNGSPIRTTDGQFIPTSHKRYQFLHNDKSGPVERHINGLERELRKIGRTIAFSRGDDQSIATVAITDEHKAFASDTRTANEYWNIELKNGYLKDKNQIKELISGSDMDRASNIAVHMAMKKVYPKYAKDIAANVFKRLKIPFSKVTTSKSMPNYSIEKFDPNEVMFKYTDPETGKVNIFNPINDEMGELGDVYIGDGNSLTSQSLFDLFVLHFGTEPGQAKAKTVIYEKDGDDVIAIKHEHVLPKLGFSIVSKANTDEVLYSIDKNRNIKNEKTGESVHILNTSDEIKIGNMFNKSRDEGGTSKKSQLGRFEAHGQSLGFIKFDEKVKDSLPHIMQWYNHVNDPIIIQAFMDTYIPKIRRKIRTALNKGINKGNNVASEGIYNLLKNLEGKNEEAFIPTIVNIARLGGGLHPSVSGLIDKIIQTQVINPIVKLSDSSGSVLDISMDMTGLLGRGEISLSSENAIKSGIVVAQYAKFRKMSLSDARDIIKKDPARINRWLKENKVYAWVSRSPVPHVGGAYMARVVSLHGRKSLVDLNPIDVKVNIEGDGDGDKVHVEMLTPENVELYKEFMKDKDSTPLNLKYFVKKVTSSIMSNSGRVKLMHSLFFGKKAIAEIANIGLSYGSMNKIFVKFQLPNGKVVMIRKPNETVLTDLYHETSKNKKWSGPVSELLRIYLQAAVDNGKYNLLSDWNYSQNTLPLKLFRYANTNQDISESDYLVYIAPILKLHKKPAYIRRGSPPLGNKFSFKELINWSQQYLAYVQDRKKFLLEGNHIRRDPKDVPYWQVAEYPITDVLLVKDGISPIEQIAIAVADNYNNWKFLNTVFGRDGTPFVLREEVHENAHHNTMNQFKEIVNKDTGETRLERTLLWYAKRDLQLGNIKDMNEIKMEKIKGEKYAKDMIDSYKSILIKYAELGYDSMERNPILLAFTEDFGSRFENISEYAKAVATYEFLREYENIRNNIAVRRSQSIAPSFPPVSPSTKQISLLDHRIIEDYFKKYNEQVTNNTDTKKLKDKPMHQSMDALTKRVCKRG